MTDRYASFVQSGAGRTLVKRLGLPDPPRLRRHTPGDPLVILEVGQRGEPRRVRADVSPGRTVLIGIPADIQAVKRQSLELALAWRIESRNAFEAAISAGLAAVDFQRQGAYLMAPALMKIDGS